MDGRLLRRGLVVNVPNPSTLRLLPPAYVSSVDSGNLAAALMTLAEGLRELAGQKVGVVGMGAVGVTEKGTMLNSLGTAEAIFLPLEESLSAVWLASRSRDLIDARLEAGSKRRAS